MSRPTKTATQELERGYLRSDSPHTVQGGEIMADI